MTNEDIISQKLALYDEAFDIYMDRGQMPKTLPPDDLLGGFMQQSINDNPQLENQDPVWKDLMKEEILKFIEAMLKLFQPIEESYRKEKDLIRVFSNGNIEKKRELWQQVYSTIKQQFTPEEVNVEGYVRQFQTSDPESVFGPLVNDWETACNNRLKEYEASTIEKYRNYWEQSVRESAQKDFQIRKQIEKMYYRYPQMVEIVKIMGTLTPRTPAL